MERLLDIEDYELVDPYVRISEQAEFQKLSNASQETVAMEAETPAGLTPDDVPDEEIPL